MNKDTTTPIESLGLEARTANLLVTAGFDTVEKLTAADWTDIKSIKGVGIAVLTEGI